MIPITKERELKSCDNVKTFAMLAVVIYHCASACSNQGWFTISPVDPSSALGFLSSFLGLYHIQLFTFVSGYLFYYLKYECGKYSDTCNFLKKKAKRLLLPYPFACLWVLPAFIFFFNPSQKEIIFNFALGEGPSQLWFLLMLFLVFAGFYFLSKILDRYSFFEKMNLKTAVLVCFFFYLLGFCSPVLDRLGARNLFQFMTAIRYFIFFFAGFAFRKFDLKKLYKISAFLMIISLSATTAFVLFVPGKLQFILTAPVCLLNCVSAFVFITKYLNPKFKLFEIFKKYSFQIYLLHQQIIYLIVYLIDRYSKFYSYPTFVISIIVTLTSSVFIAMIFTKINFCRKVFGIK